MASCSVAVVALAFWQQEPGWLRLLLAAAGTMASGWFLSQVRRPRPVAVVAVASLSVGCLLGAADTATLESIRRDWGRGRPRSAKIGPGRSRRA